MTFSTKEGPKGILQRDFDQLDCEDLIQTAEIFERQLGDIDGYGLLESKIALMCSDNELRRYRNCSIAHRLSIK